MQMRTTVLCLLVGCVAIALSLTPPVFPTDWTAYETDAMSVFQGDYMVQGAYMCCSVDAVNCQVQVQSQRGMSYFDFTNNRTRFDDDGSGQIIVTLYNQQKECLVVDGTCKEYCPLQDEVMSPFGVGDNATFKGYKVIGGVNASDWQWQETIFKIVVMETSDLFVDTSGSAPVPLLEIDQLTPFGQPIGSMNSTWTKFTAGTPDPNLFIVNGLDTCPESPNCNSDERQIRRLFQKHFKTWAVYRK